MRLAVQRVLGKALPFPVKLSNVCFLKFVSTGSELHGQAEYLFGTFPSPEIVIIFFTLPSTRCDSAGVAQDTLPHAGT